MNEKIDITELTLGMFVADLDRPWIDTPFLLQGFIIESQEQIQQLQHYCKFVYIDRHRSVGAAYQAREENVTERQRLMAPRSPMAHQEPAVSADEHQPTGLLATLKAIWGAAFGAGSSASKKHTDAGRDGRAPAAEGAASVSYME